MIVNSHEYFLALRQELKNMSEYVNSQSYSNQVVFLNKALSDELKVIEYALNSKSCITCAHKIGPISTDGAALKGSHCKLNGMYNEGFNLHSYSCEKWVWDDMPF